MTTIATGNKRLLELADTLDTIPRKRFDFAVWVGDDWQGAPDLSCGTTACALGWATTIPSLKRAGLRLKRDNGNRWSASDPWMHYGHVVTPNTDDSMRAAMEVFAITYDDAELLFSPSDPCYDHPKWYGKKILEENATPKQVASLIRRFVAARQKGKQSAVRA